MFKIFSEIKSDLSASIVVFFVALPLCLGIALASGAPLFAGIISGIIGGIVVGIASGSSLGVSGPAAGLAVIVLTDISTLGSWPIFLVSIVIAGIIQLIMGYAKMGFIAYFFPSSVIKGMLSGIGIIIILKQIPHALGYDKNYVGDLAYFQADGENTFSSITSALNLLSPEAVIITIISLVILILWDKLLTKKHIFLQILQGPVVVVLAGILLNTFFHSINIGLTGDELVNLPVALNFYDFLNQFTMPDFTAISKIGVWKTAFVLAIVASLETLLCVDATDKIDPYKRVTPANRELKAQGLGNILSGLCGGLPVTQVIVRSSANITFGGKTKLSTILHGIFLLISAATIPNLLNLIPLASLAAILIVIGYKLAQPSYFKEIYKMGEEQFVPFAATIIGIVATDLLKGIFIGMAFGIFYTLKNSYYNAYSMKDIITKENSHQIHQIVLAEEVSFFNKASIMNALNEIPKGSTVIIDLSKSKYIAYDVVELINNFKISSGLKKITVKVNYG